MKSKTKTGDDKDTRYLMCKICGYRFGDYGGGRWRLNCPRCGCCHYVDLRLDGWGCLSPAGFRARFNMVRKRCVTFLVRNGMNYGEIRCEVNKWKKKK